MQGILTNETRCLRCETVTAREETFFDLSLDIEQNSSITSCLKNFSSTETLNAEDKFFCDKCCRSFSYIFVCYLLVVLSSFFFPWLAFKLLMIPMSRLVMPWIVIMFDW